MIKNQTNGKRVLKRVKNYIYLDFSTLNMKRFLLLKLQLNYRIYLINLKKTQIRKMMSKGISLRILRTPPVGRMNSRGPGATAALSMSGSASTTAAAPPTTSWDQVVDACPDHPSTHAMTTLTMRLIRSR